VRISSSTDSRYHPAEIAANESWQVKHLYRLSPFGRSPPQLPPTCPSAGQHETYTCSLNASSWRVVRHNGHCPHCLVAIALGVY
jgi:hypothetical protein